MLATLSYWGDYTSVIKRNPELLADATKTAGREVKAEEIVSRHQNACQNHNRKMSDRSFSKSGGNCIHQGTKSR
jgi:hypothetical protein